MIGAMDLSAMQIRILGCLVEKETTTPAGYPLSTNALVNACNQSSNREPVVTYDDRRVDAAMLELRTEGLARTITGGRANKHRHILDEAWGVSAAEASILAVLFLRGPQTVGEIRTRTERMHPFGSLEDVERVLAGLANAEMTFVQQVDRQPGHKESRWVHLVGGVAAETDDQSESVTVSQTQAPELVSEDSLAADVARLCADVDRLYELLCESPGAVDT